MSMHALVAGLNRPRQSIRYAMTDVTAGTITSGKVGPGDTVPSSINRSTNSVLSIDTGGVRPSRLTLRAFQNEAPGSYFELLAPAVRGAWTVSHTFRATGAPGATMILFAGYSSTTRQWRMMMNNAGAISVFDNVANAAIGSSSTALSANTDYRFEYRYNGTTFEWRIFNIDTMTTHHSTSGTPANNMSIDRLRVGSAAQNVTPPTNIYFDDIIMTDGYEILGPPRQ